MESTGLTAERPDQESGLRQSTSLCCLVRRHANHNNQPCYTVVALSDLAVSGSEPSKVSLPGTVFPKPLQTGVPKKRSLLLGVERNHKSLSPGDSALDHEWV
jgi:hypothetical protein